MHPHASLIFFVLPPACGGSQGKRAEDQGVPASPQVLQWWNPRGDFFINLHNNYFNFSTKNDWPMFF
jgi:hypothetical protein